MVEKVFNQRIAPVVASIVAVTLAIVKVVLGIISWSVALLASALDSLMDMLVSIMNYFAIKFSLTPPDKEHQYWHWKIEGIASTIEGTVIFSSGIFLIWESIKKIINTEPIKYLDVSMYAMIFSIILTSFLVWYLYKVYKKSNSLIIKWDILHYKTDLFINIWVLIALAIVYFTGYHIVDAIVGWLLGLYIMKESVELIKEWVDILLDKSIEEFDEVKKILDNFVQNWIIKSYHCLKTRYLGNNTKYVEFHMVVDPNLTILQAHKIWDKIEDQIKQLDPNSKWYVNYHQDPHDDAAINWCI